MKQAFLICAHNNPEYLGQLIDSLDTERTNIYVHIDKNNEAKFTNFAERFKNRSNVKIYSKIYNKYCGIGIVRSIAFLIQESLKNEDNGYFHFISGQDLLTRPTDEILDFFEYNKDKSYLEFFELPKKGWGIKGGMEKYLYYYLNDNLKCDDYHKFNKLLNNVFLAAQIRLNLKRKGLPFTKPYGGSAWWSINRDAASVLNDYFSIESNWDCIKHTYIPDEFIFQTVLCNSCVSESLVPNNLRYIAWTPGKGTSHPKNLELGDYLKIVESGCFFARKIDPKVSSSLIDKFSSQFHEKK